MNKELLENLSEMNRLLLIMRTELPEYSERIGKVINSTTEILNKELEFSNKLSKFEIESWYKRNN